MGDWEGEGYVVSVLKADEDEAVEENRNEDGMFGGLCGVWDRGQSMDDSRQR